MILFNYFKKKPKMRILHFNDKYIPQTLDKDGGYSGLTLAGGRWLSQDNQYSYCGLNSLKEAEDLLNSIYVAKEYY